VKACTKRFRRENVAGAAARMAVIGHHALVCYPVSAGALSTLGCDSKCLPAGHLYCVSPRSNDCSGFPADFWTSSSASDSASVLRRCQAMRHQSDTRPYGQAPYGVRKISSNVAGGLHQGINRALHHCVEALGPGRTAH
jgi:hypothetical protein